LEPPYKFLLIARPEHSDLRCFASKPFWVPDLQQSLVTVFSREPIWPILPTDKQQRFDRKCMMTLIAVALAGGLCVFKSAQFNKDCLFFDGARALLKKLPDRFSPDWLIRY